MEALEVEAVDVDELAIEELVAELDAVVVELACAAFDEYFRVTLVTLMSRYFKVWFWGGGSAR
ncbi:MAG: hypothetical protein JRM80_08525 [Nitrososphaerota archaeon]|nr:hypothetical protein [Nitrososphaerota archaeon]